MRILVTGGAGYLGRVLVDALIKRGHSVTVLDALLYLDQEQATAELSRWFHGATDFQRKDAFGFCDISHNLIIHLAAIVGDAQCRKNQRMAWHCNADSTAWLSAFGVPMILPSTASVYGDAGGALCAEDAVVNTDPGNVYVHTKLEAERIVLDHGGTVLRMGTLFGVSPRQRYDLFINDMVRHAALEQRFEVYAPAAIRPWLAVEDAAALMADTAPRVVARDPAVAGVFNVAAFNMSKGDVLDTCAARWPVHAQVYPEADSDRRNYGVDSAKAAARLHFRPLVSLEEGFNRLHAKVRKESGR